MRVVLLVELALSAGAAVILLRITPAVQDVAALAAAAAGVAGGLRGGGAVVDHKQLTVAADTDHDLIEPSVVVDAVGVVPELLDFVIGHTVHVNQLRVVGNHAVVALAGVKVLNHVVPDMPLPDHVAAAATGGFYLYQIVRQHVALGRDAAVEQCRVEAGCDRLGVALLLACQNQYIAVGQHLEIVVRDVGRTVVVEAPHQVAGPVVFLNAPALAAAGGRADVGHGAGADHVAVFQQVGGAPRLAGAGPFVHVLPGVVEQVGGGAVQGRHQGVAGEGLAGAVEHQTNRAGNRGAALVRPHDAKTHLQPC